MIGVPTTFSQLLHKVAVWIFLALLCSTIIRLLLLLDFNKRVYNHSPGPCRMLHDITNGSAGIEFSKEHNLVFITTGLLRSGNRTSAKSGLFAYAFAAQTDQPVQHKLREVTLEKFNPKEFAPFGLSSYSSKGRLTLYVVNRFAFPNCVEVFAYQKDRATATHKKSICHPAFTSLQDIVVVGPDRFFVTNTNYFVRPWLQLAEDLLQAASGSLYLFDGKALTAPLPHLPAPGGIAYDAKRGLIFIGLILNESIRVFSLTPSLELDAKTEISLLSSPMGIFIEADSGDIWTALLPIMHSTFYHLSDPEEKRIRAPSQVLRIRMQDDGSSWVVTEPYANDGATISGSCSVAYANEQMLIGSLFGRLLHCDVLNPQIT